MTSPIGLAKSILKQACRALYLLERLRSHILTIGVSQHYRPVLGSNAMRILHPAHIVNPHRMKCRTFVAGEGLRIDILERYRGQVFEPSLVVGDNFHAEKNLHIGVISHMRIGSDVLVGSNVLIVDHNHGSCREGEARPDLPPADRLLTRGRPVTIGDKVWIGDGAVVLPGTTIGDRTIVGANAVVSGNIPPDSVVAGPRATVVRTWGAAGSPLPPA